MALISPEHSQALVWNEDEENVEDADEAEDYVERVDRMFTFEVAKTKEEEEGVVPKPGFTVSSYAFAAKITE